MKRLLLTFAVLVILIVCGFGVIAPRVQRYLLAPPSHWPGDKFMLFEIKDGANAGSVAEQLAKKGIIRSSWQFKRTMRNLGIESKLRPGLYKIEPGKNAEEIAKQLGNHDTWTIKVTLPEGLTIAQIAERIEKAGKVEGGQWLPKAKEIRAAATADAYRQATGIGLPTKSAEGYLFPATYQFEAGSKADQIVAVMFREFFTRFVRKYEDPIRTRRLTPHELVTLASIVEREAVKDTERPIIAQVFLNRIARGMKLESCATVEYILPQHKARLTYRDIRTPSPYNTYVNRGLPPGPICNPGDASLKAAVYPQKTSALYFVSNGDGTHTFSTTYQEHLAAKARIESSARGGSDRAVKPNAQADSPQAARP